MATITGTGVGTGVAIGPVARMAAPLAAPADTASTLTPEAERARFDDAVAAVAAELERRGEAAGGTAQEVLEAQAMMVADPTLADSVDIRLAAGATAETAAWESCGEVRAILEEAGGYLAERAADLDDIAQRLVAHLRGVDAPGLPNPGVPHILVAVDLAPADTALLSEHVLAIVTGDGGPTSHTAILARERAVPAVVGIGSLSELRTGATVIVDAAAHSVIVAPTGAELTAAENARDAARAINEAPIIDGALADGTPVPLLANLGSPDGAESALAKGAEGVGLFRTEFLFLSASSAPTIAEQQREYERMFTAFGSRKVVVRALDAGSDKPLSFLTDDGEHNPALGRRGLRALRANESVLREQLTALAQAQAAVPGCEVQVMAPMVATVEEARYFVDLAHEFGLASAGVMVEVPAAAVLADRMLPHVDFVSIGTNDLTQYTMAADRQLGSVAELQDPWHPAVLRLIAMIGEAGRTHSVPVGICGEAAADPLLAVVLVGLGATTLSMAGSALAGVRHELAQVTGDQARAIAAAALNTDDAAGARAAASAARTATSP